MLSPTRTYAPVVKAILEKYKPSVHGMIHCSGGAQTKVLHFIKNIEVTKDNMFAVPPLFRLIQNESGTSREEMYRVFNMGHRLEMYVPETIAGDIIALSQSFGVDARIIGHCKPSSAPKVIIRDDSGTYSYTS